MLACLGPRPRCDAVIIFCTDTATTVIYTLSLHDALPIFGGGVRRSFNSQADCFGDGHFRRPRSEEHTSELQSHSDLVCRLLLEKKNITPHAVTTLPVLDFMPASTTPSACAASSSDSSCRS